MKHKRNGFSLLEILAVLAIITILAALLFPVLSSAKKSAKRITCISNLHQIGLAAGLYQGDWNDELPPVNPLGWMNPHAQTVSKDTLSNYGTTPDIYRCPEYTKRGDSEVKGVNNYIMRFTFDQNDEDFTLITYRILPDANSVIAFCDMHLTKRIGPWNGKLTEGGLFNVLRNNGSVEKVNTSKVVVHTNNWGGFDPSLDPSMFEWWQFPNEVFPPRLDLID